MIPHDFCCFDCLNCSSLRLLGATTQLLLHYSCQIDMYVYRIATATVNLTTSLRIMILFQLDTSKRFPEVNLSSCSYMKSHDLVK
jgi:hypothetical protein